jgi:hypothetical protein
MDADDRAKLQQESLLHESDQLHDNIQRNLNEMHKLLALGFPVLTGAFALAVAGKIVDVADKRLIYVLFAILMSLLIISFNNIWMQLLTFTRYKYSQILPQLYAISGRTGDNYGQHIVRGGLLRAMVGAVIVQSILLPMGVVAACQVDPQSSNDLLYFALLSYFAVFVAGVTTLISWRAAYDAMEMVRASSAQVPAAAKR